MDFWESASGILYNRIYLIHAAYGGCSWEANVLNKAETYRGTGRKSNLKYEKWIFEECCVVILQAKRL